MLYEKKKKKERNETLNGDWNGKNKKTKWLLLER